MEVLDLTSKRSRRSPRNDDNNGSDDSSTDSDGARRARARSAERRRRKKRSKKEKRRSRKHSKKGRKGHSKKGRRQTRYSSSSDSSSSSSDSSSSSSGSSFDEEGRHRCGRLRRAIYESRGTRHSTRTPHSQFVSREANALKEKMRQVKRKEASKAVHDEVVATICNLYDASRPGTSKLQGELVMRGEFDFPPPILQRWMDDPQIFQLRITKCAPVKDSILGDQQSFTLDGQVLLASASSKDAYEPIDRPPPSTRL